MTAPDQRCSNVKKLLLIKRRPHMTHGGHSPPKFAVMHNAAVSVVGYAIYLRSNR
jgi:hypothetical protein